MRILTIDDDEALCMAIEIALSENGDEAMSLYNLDEVGKGVRELKPDLILLDIEFEEHDGVHTLPEIQIAAPDAIIIFFSSHTTQSDVVRALRKGGIMFLKKPISCDELVAQINGLKRSMVTHEHTIHLGSFAFYPKSNLLVKEGKEQKLSTYQALLLKLLATHIDQTVSRQEIYQHIWHDEVGNELTLNNMVSQLRKSLKADPQISIQTIGGVGYKLCVTN